MDQKGVLDEILRRWNAASEQLRLVEANIDAAKKEMFHLHGLIQGYNEVTQMLGPAKLKEPPIITE